MLPGLLSRSRCEAFVFVDFARGSSFHNRQIYSPPRVVLEYCLFEKNNKCVIFVLINNALAVYVCIVPKLLYPDTSYAYRC